jgi:hypothetical protein
MRVGKTDVPHPRVSPSLRASSAARAMSKSLAPLECDVIPASEIEGVPPPLDRQFRTVENS